MGFISQQGLENLKKYKYISGGRTMLDNLMNPWWEFVTTCMPMNMAPNLITLVGLIINIAGCVIYLRYDTQMTQLMPAWMYFVSATCSFIYQTLDAVDGKQARRTNTSSPLGQLFDHGCDAVTLFFGLVIFGQLARSGTDWSFFLLLWSLTLTFYTQQWEEYHTHIFRTCIGNWGVTEGLVMQLAFLYGVALTSGGLAEWTLETMLPFIPWYDYLGKLTVTQVSSIMICYNAVTYTWVNIKSGLEASRFSTIEALLGLSPLVYFWGEALIVFSTEWGWNNPALAVILFFPSYCLMTCKHIVCSVCLMPFEPLQWSPLVYLAFLINKYALTIQPTLKQYQMSGAVGTDYLVPESQVALFVFLFTLVAFSRFVLGCIKQITTYLDIYCLTIKPKRQ